MEIEVPLSAADADDMAEYKKRRLAERAGKPLTESVSPEPISAPKGETEPPVSETASAPKGESAGVSETPSAQDNPKRGTSEKRIKDLISSNSAKDQRIADLEKLVAQGAKPIETPAPRTEQAPPVDNGPQWKEFLDKADPNEDLVTVQTRYLEARSDWKEKLRETTRAQAVGQERTHRMVTAARQKYGDDVVTAALGTQGDQTSGVWLHTGVLAALRDAYDNAMDVVVHLHQNPAELRRIQGLHPAQQIVAVGKLAESLTATTPARSEPPKPKAGPVPVSRIPAPHRPIGGSEPEAPKPLGEAATFEEHKAARRRQA